MVNEWTRDDLPSVIKSHRYGNMHFSRIQEVEAYKDDVVDHLNANYPKPAPGLLSSAADCVLDAEDRARSAKADADRLRRAHEIVEAERDQACDERDEAVARAEAAEARTAPAVTKRELRSVVAAHDPGDDELAVSRVNALTDRLWSLVSGADPAVFVVRESDLPEAWRDRDGLWRAGQSSYCRVTPEDMRSVIPATLGMVAARESVARAIEAEEAEAVDPVEAAIRRGLTVWGVTDKAVQEIAASVRHVLGQEGRHVDQ